MKTTTPKRTPEQNERVELVRGINDEVNAGLEIRAERWHRAVNGPHTQALQEALAHLKEARRIIQTVTSPSWIENEVEHARLSNPPYFYGGGK
jgi:plasmid stability protein